jgi:glycosyltransferase involved in cell wall biosynthesis
VLALSLGLPVVLADMPAYRELTEARQPGWPFSPGDSASLRAALEAAAADPADARARGKVALELAEGLRWPEIAERSATLMLGDRMPGEQRRSNG